MDKRTKKHLKNGPGYNVFTISEYMIVEKVQVFSNDSTEISGHILLEMYPWMDKKM